MPSEERLDEAYERARAAYDDDREPIALELLSEYVRHRPEHGHAWYLLGDCLRILGLPHEAEQALNRALGLAPDHARWAIEARIGRTHADAGNHDVAEHWFAKAAESEEAARTSWVWIFRGANFARQCQLKAAEGCHRRAVTIGDDLEDEAWLNLGYVLRAMGRYGEAALAFEKALSITPDYIEASTALLSLNGIEEAADLARELRQ